MNIDYDDIKRLIDLVEGNGLIELTVEQEEITVTVKAESGGERVSVFMPGASHALPAEHETLSPEPEIEEVAAELIADSSHLFEIKSPMVGIYYRYPSPDSPPFVEVGEHVLAGQTIGLIEAMKVFSEIPSDVAGKVTAIPVGNGKLIQQGEVIMVIDTSSTE